MDTSPLPRKQDYTPALSQQMSAASAAATGQPTPAVTPQHISFTPGATPNTIPAHYPSAKQPGRTPGSKGAAHPEPSISYTGDLLYSDAQLMHKMTSEAQVLWQAVPPRPETVARLDARLRTGQQPDTSAMDKLKGGSQALQAGAREQPRLALCVALMPAQLCLA